MNTLISSKSRWILSALLTGGISMSANAALLDRGNGMLYDTVLNVTWLQDANYAKTSGYDADGKLDWYGAVAWAEQLEFGGYGDWRLPSIKPVNGVAYNENFTDDGSSDYAFNVSSQQSELGYMYFVNLGLTAFQFPDGSDNPNFGIYRNGDTGGQNDVGLVKNLQSLQYWSGDEVPARPDEAWFFDTALGSQQNYYKSGAFSIGYAWAVRDGDVAAVPLPGAVWLFSSVVMGFLYSGRSKADNTQTA
ncbi:Lcl domain-containing protein [Methylomonas sp. MgM2]